MTVKQLIESLSKLPEDFTVGVDSSQRALIRGDEILKLDVQLHCDRVILIGLGTKTS